MQDRIGAIWSFDGPGMNLEMARTEGFEAIRGKIRSYIPQSSIIGLLMEYYKPYTVVRSTARGLDQHEPLTWQVYGGHFEEMDAVDRSAEVTCETLHEWLSSSTPEQKKNYDMARKYYVESSVILKPMEELRRIDADREKLEAMKIASRSIAPVDAADIIYNTVVQTCKR